MTINNFDKITPLLDTSNPDIFYIVQILQRKSENPLITSKGKQLKTLHVNSERTLDEEKVITLCDNLNARAYININPVSYRKGL